MLRQPIPKMAAAAANLLCAVIDSRDTLIERRVFSAQFIEGATARLHVRPAEPAPAAISAAGIRTPVAIM